MQSTNKSNRWFITAILIIGWVIGPVLTVRFLANGTPSFGVQEGTVIVQLLISGLGWRNFRIKRRKEGGADIEEMP